MRVRVTRVERRRPVATGRHVRSAVVPSWSRVNTQKRTYHAKMRRTTKRPKKMMARKGTMRCLLRMAE